MPTKKLSVPLTPDMEKALNDLCERHAYQLPTLASVLLRDALAGRRSPLLSKRVSAPQSAQRRKTAQSLSRLLRAKKRLLGAPGAFWEVNPNEALALLPVHAPGRSAEFRPTQTLPRSEKPLLRHPGALFSGAATGLVGWAPNFGLFDVARTADRGRRDVGAGRRLRRRAAVQNSPPGRRNQIQNTTNSPPTRGIFRDIRLSGGAFCGPAQRNGATPATARVSAPGKVYI